MAQSTDPDSNQIPRIMTDPIDKEKKAFLDSISQYSSNELSKLIKQSAIIAIYSAAAVGSSVTLLLIPNLETITLFIFLVSFIHGYRTGFGMMVTTVMIFELFASTYYGAATYLIPFKLVAYSITVVTGAFIGTRYGAKFVTNENNIANDQVYYSIVIKLSFALIGITLTMIYDLSTLVADVIIVPSFDFLIIRFIIGLPWFFFHEILNGILFMLIPTLARMIFHSQILNNNLNRMRINNGRNA